MICLPFAFSRHVSSASANVAPWGWMHEVDVARRASERGGRLTGLDVVDRDRPAERHVEMRVRIDAAGQDVPARRVDHTVRVDVERLADAG